MILKKFDLFASEFSFYLENKQQNRKKTWKGGLVSIIIIGISLYYFIYLMQNYSQNKIDPKYKLQSFISEDKIEYMPQNDYFGFDLAFLNGKLSDLEQQTGKQYLTFIPAFSVSLVGQQDPIYIMLDIFQCQSEKLKGYKCIDFSKSQGYQLVLNDSTNYISELMIVVYKCTDTDFFKKTVPNNCASDQEINDLLNSKNNQFEIKMKVSQFNTTSEKMEDRYKRYYTNLQTNFMVYTNQLITKLQTDVKQGIFLQNTQTYSSIIDYVNQQQRNFDREILKQQSNIYALLQLNILLDEQIQYAQIQYVTILEVLSIFNSTLAILMGAGLLSRYFSNRIIYNQFQQSFFNQFFNLSHLQANMQVIDDKKSKNKDQIQNCIIQLQSIISYLLQKQNKIKNESNSDEEIDKVQQQICDLNDLDEQNKIKSYQILQMNSTQIDKIIKNSFLNHQKQISISQSPSKEIRNNLIQQCSILEKQGLPLSQNTLLSSSLKKQFNTENQTNKNIQRDTQNFNPSNKLLPLEQKCQKSSLDKNIQMNNTIEYGSICQDLSNQPRQVDQKIIKNLIELKNKNVSINKLQKLLKDKELFMKTTKFQDLFEKSLNIQDIYKDIFFIKKAIMILLSEEQYAAIQIIGYQLGQNQINHINQQIKQENSQELLIQNLCNFFDQMSYSNEYNQINQRILNSLII
ncbi:hypothetical protein ABPG74_020708 [Tetrahymena malaccensis]